MVRFFSACLLARGIVRLFHFSQPKSEIVFQIILLLLYFILLLLLLFYFFNFFLLFRAAPMAHRVSSLGGLIRATASSPCCSHSNAGAGLELHLWPTPQLMAVPDPQARPEVKPAPSWILVGFVSAVPQWELRCYFLFICLYPCKSS